MLKAIRNVASFRRLIDKFDQAKLPREELLKNTVTRDLGIPAQDVDQFLDIVMRNLSDWGMVHDYQGNRWLRSDKLAIVENVERVEEGDSEGDSETSDDTLPSPEAYPTASQPQRPVPRAFISHSKNKTILSQIKTILEFGQFKYIIAEEVETASIPIPDKVFGLMSQCNCAIINVSADKKEKADDGAYRVNPNVLIEIGGAFLKYDKRVILLTDKRVTLPSNLQGLYRCEYEGEELSFSAAMKLQTALSSFRNIEV